MDWARLAVDDQRDEIYVNNGTSLMARLMTAGEGKLLRNKDGKPFYCVDICVGYDGTLYCRTGVPSPARSPAIRGISRLRPLPPALTSSTKSTIGWASVIPTRGLARAPAANVTTITCTTGTATLSLVLTARAKR